jgi:hypothetical protein
MNESNHIKEPKQYRKTMGWKKRQQLDRGWKIIDGNERFCKKVHTYANGTG